MTLSLQVGCVRVGRNVKTVINRYEVGSFNAASRQCSELAQLQDEMNEKAHVRYLVYCGLTHYRLGRRPNAQLLLSRGVDEYQQGRSSWIKPGIADEMYKALDDLEGRPHARVTPPPFERHSRRNKQVDVEADASEEEDDE
ncbi:MAG: hypothetical protein U0271_03130 [Polyangiaceae bacterium]